MNILFLGGSDNADISNRVCKGLRVNGAYARTLTAKRHPFGYVQDLVGEDGIATLLAEGVEFDWIIGVGDSNYGTFDRLRARLGPLVANARLAIRHGGTAFRTRVALCNKNDRKFERRFVGSDLYRFVKDDPKAAPYFAPADTIAARVEPHWTGPLRVGHSPSKRHTKGTEMILDALRGLDGIELELIERVSFKECAERRARCHLFVDQINPSIGGFGASTVEALSAGCAVLVDIRHIDPAVWAFYPRPPVLEVRSAPELRARVQFLVRDRHTVEDFRAQSHAWASTVASPAAVGAYWLKHLEGTR